MEFGAKDPEPDVAARHDDYLAVLGASWYYLSACTFSKSLLKVLAGVEFLY